MNSNFGWSSRVTCEGCPYSEFGRLPQRGIIGAKFQKYSGCCKLSQRSDNKVDFLIETGEESCRFRNKSSFLKAKGQFDQMIEREAKDGNIK
jgi:hypothetical protein